MKREGKVAVVSGGGSGSGRATVLALAEQGSKILIVDFDEGGGWRTVDMVAERGGTAVFTRCDVTKTADLEAAFANAVERFGQCDIAFNNNAGIGGGTCSPIIRATGSGSSKLI